MNKRQWAVDKAREIENRIESRERESSKRISEEKLRKAQAPRLWDEVKKELAEFIGDLNAAGAGTIKLLDHDEDAQVTVGNYDINTRLKFQPDGPTPTLEVMGQTSQRYYVKVQATNVGFFDENSLGVST